MAAIGVRHIDFFVLDVEGAEIPILKTIDWSRLTIDLLNIEYGQRSWKVNELRAFFNSTHKEVGKLPRGQSDTGGQDVLFMRNSIQR